MIARVAVALSTLGLSLGALYMLYEHRAPIQATIIEPSGITETHIYTPDPILYIDIQADAITHIRQEEGKPLIRLEADQAVFPFLELKVTNDTLTILRHDPSNTVFTTQPPCLYIVIPDIAAIYARGNAQVFSQNTLTIDSLDINTRSNAAITLSIHTKQLDIEAHGQSSLYLTGTAHEQHIALYGSTKYDGTHLQSLECAIDASDATNAYLHVVNILQGTISGTSKIHFFGDPYIFVTKNNKATLQKLTYANKTHKVANNICQSTHSNN